jgi:hypothetical protein
VRKPTQKELTDPHYAYWYARDVIKGRFKLGETTIAKSPFYAYHYAHDIIKGRWEQVEPTIATDEYGAYWYACNVLEFSLENENELIPIDFYAQCFRSKTLDIHQLPQKLQNNPDIQVAYFKVKVLI